MKIQNRQSSVHSAIMLIVSVALILITFFVAVPIFAIVFNSMITPTQYSQYHDSVNCTLNKGTWADSKCVSIDLVGYKTLKTFRKAWLVAPIILIFSLVFWYFTKIWNKDNFQYGGGGEL